MFSQRREFILAARRRLLAKKTKGLGKAPELGQLKEQQVKIEERMMQEDFCG